MAVLKVGDKAPDFVMPTENDGKTRLADYVGQYLVLYFYPRDNTPGCTIEAKDFSSLKSDFESLNCRILGVSRDSIKKHENFIAKQNLSISLGADLEGKVTEDYGVWAEKKLYGKTYMGIVRATFLIDPDGVVVVVWPKVKVKNHAEDVLATLKSLQT
ncbi:MAG: thioredoxin-dependent thiol peroxidase [Hellea sp.]|nr:thioredoxin-dependent thiol peroxidase [Hellea sp.]